MRNGTRFNSKLTLVDNSQNSDDDSAVYYPYQPENSEGEAAQSDSEVKTTLIVFISVSIACAAAAVATGSYAAWLIRHQAARRALTDVDDILRACQARMRQLEADVQRLPSRNA